ncbi:uncharacterized protein LOC114536362 [Dendronephthya gigantea]|uniref:uncharacterized protein LOC114536362 n=1 Tax=Dendronephthya gigantea TaxID=151771 RepID=UPI00106B494F|nr:uncharacterized protein LOC114536362 [Dendronephthya gigantea]
MPALLFGEKYGVEHVDHDVNITSVVIVVSPLNALITNQVNRLKLHGIEAAVLDIKSSVAVNALGGDSGASSKDLSEDEDKNTDTDAVCDLLFSDRKKLGKGQYNIVFAHPEVLVSSKYGRKLMQSKTYQENVCAVVIDEAHCILE